MSRANLQDKIKELLDANLNNDHFGVKELAAGLGYSRSHLHRILHKQFGKSASQYIREYRLEKALQLIREEELNVSEAAFRVGFGSASYFSKSFTSYFGYSPSELLSGEVLNEELIQQDVPDKVPRGKWEGLRIPVVILAISLLLALGFVLKNYPDNKQSAHEDEASIAMLPFVSLSNDPDNQYLCDGIGDALARKLSGIEELKVVSRMSATSFVEDHTPFIQIADKLGVNYIMEGSIQRKNDRVRVEVGLVNGRTGIRIWSDNYDKSIDDIFKIENEIAEHVAVSLSKELTPVISARTNRGYTSNTEAYDLFLRGKFELRTYTQAGSLNSEKLFKEAVKLDPNFAMAYNWLGHSYIAQSAIFSGVREALDGLEMAIGPIEKSIELAPSLKETRPIRAFYYLYHDWDFERAEQEYLASLNSIEPESYALYIDYLNFVRKHDEALMWSEKLEDSEPFYPNTRMILSLYYTGNVEEAISRVEAKLKIMKNYYLLDSYGFVLLNSERYDEAIEVFKEIFEIENLRYPRILGWMGAAYARSDQQNEAQEILNELLALKEKSNAGSPCFFAAVVQSAMGNADKALELIREAIEQHEMEIPWLISEPQFFNLHSYPEFEKMVDEVGFPE